MSDAALMSRVSGDNLKLISDDDSSLGGTIQYQAISGLRTRIKPKYY